MTSAARTTLGLTVSVQIRSHYRGAAALGIQVTPPAPDPLEITTPS
ncbi:MAG: hypothetical protein ACRDRE_13100 [Pseudonocardiaceae bacterium]